MEKGKEKSNLVKTKKIPIKRFGRTFFLYPCSICGSEPVFNHGYKWPGCSQGHFSSNLDWPKEYRPNIDPSYIEYRDFEKINAIVNLWNLLYEKAHSTKK